jgi:Tfp pilus assembly PilM family ATPase
MSIFGDKIVGIDFHDYSAELVEISVHGKNKYLEAYNRVMIPSDVIVNGEIKKMDELKIILRSLFQDANPDPIETKSLAITFPSNKIITHIFTFPIGLSEAEIRKAITFEAETVMPFSISDVYWDCTVIEKDNVVTEHSSQHVLFACINKAVADQYCELFDGIDTIPVLFSVMPDSLRYSLPKEMINGKTILIVDMDTLATNYLILKDSVIKHFFSGTECGGKLVKDLAEDNQLPENIVVDLKEKNQLATLQKLEQLDLFINKNYKRAKMIVDEYEASNKGERITNILLSGKFVNLPNFMSIAKTYFEGREVSMGDPKLGISIEPTRFVLDAADEHAYIPYSIYFNNAIGSALRALNTPYSNGINLLPDPLKENALTKKKALFFVLSTIFMTLITLFIATFLSFQSQNQNYQRDILIAKRSAMDKMIYGTRYQTIRDQITTFNREVNELSAIDHSLFSVPDIIDKIYKLIPQGISITAFDFSDQNLEFNISGIADDRNILLEAQNNLKKADFIDKVIAPISNYDEKTKISFEMKISLSFTKLNKYGSSANAK